MANTCNNSPFTKTNAHARTHTLTCTHARWLPWHNSNQLIARKPPQPKNKLFSPCKYSKHQNHTTLTNFTRMQQQRQDSSQNENEKSTFGPAILFPLWGAADNGPKQKAGPTQGKCRAAIASQHSIWVRPPTQRINTHPCRLLRVNPIKCDKLGQNEASVVSHSCQWTIRKFDLQEWQLFQRFKPRKDCAFIPMHIQRFSD